MLVDVIKCAKKNQINLLRYLLRVFFDISHFAHNHLQLLLNHMLLLGERDIFRYCISTCIGVGILYP